MSSDNMWDKSGLIADLANSRPVEPLPEIPWLLAFCGALGRTRTSDARFRKPISNE